MAYSSSCNCGEIKFSFEFDPMLHFLCHCSTCQKIFGTSLCALTMPEHEIEIEGHLSQHTVTGGSGQDMHYYFCAKCSTIIYNKPEVMGGMAYVLAGAFAEQIEFKPVMELWVETRPSWMSKADSIVESFDDNGTITRIQELLENLEQRN